MKLYWAPKTRAMSAVWVLEEAGAQYERSLIDIRAGAQMTAAYRAINPMGKVPALEDDGTIVTEAAAICAHVADRFPAASLAPPIGDSARGAFYRWLVFEPGCIEPAFMQKHIGLEVDSVTAAWGSYDRVIDTLDTALATGPWILGENFTAADVMIGGAVRFGMAIGMIERRASFAAYVSHCEGRPAFQRALLIDERGV
ncbi:MAG: glutathione S-transferase family protein [Rhodospirillaceae bacterium]|nr:glutathione S-transferase family protein [Rhodospirillaceae bacterium]